MIARLAVVAVTVAVGACAHPAPAPHPTSLPSWSRDGLHVTGAPPVDPEIAKQLEAYDDTIGYRLLDYDERLGVLAEHGGELEHVSMPQKGMRALTPYDFDVDWASYYHDHEVVFTSDRDGDEVMRLWQRPLGVLRAEPKPFERGTASVFDPFSGGMLWWTLIDDHGNSMLFNDKGPYSVREGAARWSILDDWRGIWLLARRATSAHDVALHQIDISTKIDTEIATGASVGAFGGWGEVYAACTCGGDRAELYMFDHGRRTALAPELTGDVTAIAASAEHDLVAFTTEDDGTSTLHLYDRKARTHRVVDQAPAGGVVDSLRFSRIGATLAFSFSDPLHPRDIHVYDPRADRVERWTQARAVPGAAPTHATIASFDNTPIHALVYRPEHAVGVVLQLHGGPEDHFAPTWSPLVQALVARGWAVVQPNVRGSTGYGEKFAALDDGPHREDAVRDVGAVLDWVARDRELAGPIAVLGESYGGYLALASLAAYPERFAAGIALSPIADLPAFLAHTAGYRADDRRAEYGDERVPATRDFLAKISPIAHAAKIRAPLLVAHGKRDPRVPIEATDRFVDSVRAAGGRVWYAVADDEGHLFAKTANRELVEALTLQLLASVSRSR